MRLSNDECWSRLRSAEHGILCTSGTGGAIDAVPTCYAVVSEKIVAPIDRIKSKTTTYLGRLRNLDRNPAATLICDEWNGRDWSQLWWVRAHMARLTNDEYRGGAQIDSSAQALREKYPQYRDTEFAQLIFFDVASLTGWAAAPADQEVETEPLI